MPNFLGMTILIIMAALLGHIYAEMTDNVQAKPQASRRIWGGGETTIEENPWQVVIMREPNQTMEYLCGGSIISKDWVLSAAHCFPSLSEPHYVQAGTTKINLGGSFHRIIEFILHPNFTFAAFQFNDIALLRVNESFIMDKTRQAVPLFMENEKIPEGSMITVSGWGYKDDDTLPTVLNRVEIPTIPMLRCHELLRVQSNVSVGVFCAAYLEGGKDSCKGDSGGPATVDGRLAGVVSSGIPFCGFPGAAGFYTEIPYFRGWIKEICNV